VAITVESRFCMNMAVATISAVSRVRRATTIRTGRLGGGALDSYIIPSVAPERAGEKPRRDDRSRQTGEPC
jgi:hypothetical protein